MSTEKAGVVNERSWSAHGNAQGVFIIDTTDEASTAHPYMSSSWARELAHELLRAADEADALSQEENER